VREAVVRWPGVAAGLAALLTSVPVLAGPDFASEDRAQPLAASDAHREQDPSDELEFAYDSAALLPGAQTQLFAVASWLSRHPGHRLVIEGHADSAGGPARNEELATRRVQAARDQLIAAGVASDRIVLAVFGENRAQQVARARDRRVVMLASTVPLSHLVNAALDDDAIEVSWTRDGSVLRETRGITPIAPAVTSGMTGPT
jgi:outer membrane protein OmpA-like peptidoglycan-associated protein